MAAEFSLPLRVYIEDTDAGGIVYYVNYLKFMERARTEFMRELGFGKEFVFNRALMFVVRDVNLAYVAPAQLDDELRASATIESLGGANMVLSQSVSRGEQVLVRGQIRIVCVDRDTLKPKRMPGEMLTALRGLGPGE
jgi:tol-pal system-associated acyl-CoA thioesterase